MGLMLTRPLLLALTSRCCDPVARACNTTAQQILRYSHALEPVRALRSTHGSGVSHKVSGTTDRKRIKHGRGCMASDFTLPRGCIR